jgi:hypothetical protein
MSSFTNMLLDNDREVATYQLLDLLMRLGLRCVQDELQPVWKEIARFNRDMSR